MALRTRGRGSLGQHFLADRRAVARIVEALELTGGEAVLEIGPGRGVLTAELVRAAGRIAAVELDDGLAGALAKRFGPEQLVLFRGDVLKLDFAKVLAALGAPMDARLVLVGNLPYAISKPVAQQVIACRRQVDRAVLMFQREVARRLTAPPGSRERGPLGILAMRAWDIELLFDLAPGAFSPPPRVHASVTRWRERAGAPLADAAAARLVLALRIGFARRRRTLRNNLRAALPDDAAVDALLAATGVDGTLRPEQLGTEAFERIGERLSVSAPPLV